MVWDFFFICSTSILVQSALVKQEDTDFMYGLTVKVTGNNLSNNRGALTSSKMSHTKMQAFWALNPPISGGELSIYHFRRLLRDLTVPTKEHGDTTLDF